MATIDADGYLKITDRIKDLIKSGGEWISSVDMENALVAHPAVAEAAVIAIPDPKWLERPLAVVVLKAGASRDGQRAAALSRRDVREMAAAGRRRVRAGIAAYLDREAVEVRAAIPIQEGTAATPVGRAGRRLRELVMSYRVDTVPCRAPVLSGGRVGLRTDLYLYFVVCRLTSRISIDGPGDHDLSQHAIFCVWHQQLVVVLGGLRRYPSPHATFSHPAAYMKPIHDTFRLMGLKPLLLARRARKGRRAADELARLVQTRFSTTISPDGRMARRGC